MSQQQNHILVELWCSVVFNGTPYTKELVLSLGTPGPFASQPSLRLADLELLSSFCCSELRCAHHLCCASGVHPAGIQANH